MFLNNGLVRYSNGPNLSDHQMAHYSGHGLNNGLVKVRNLNGYIIQMSGIRIPTVLHYHNDKFSCLTFHLTVNTILNNITAVIH